MPLLVLTFSSSIVLTLFRMPLLSHNHKLVVMDHKVRVTHHSRKSHTLSLQLLINSHFLNRIHFPGLLALHINHNIRHHNSILACSLTPLAFLPGKALPVYHNLELVHHRRHQIRLMAINRLHCKRFLHITGFQIVLQVSHLHLDFHNGPALAPL